MEVDIDVPEGMTEEEYLAQQGPILKVFCKSPSGEDIEIPRGMNLGTMGEAGMIPPLEEDDYEEGGENAEMSGTGQRQNARGVFDPTAVKGAQERSTEMNELYAKVIANKAKVSDSRDGTPTSDQKESSMLSPNGFASTQTEGGSHLGEAQVLGVQSESKSGGAGDVKEMVGYDFILQDRDDEEGDAARKARASTRCDYRIPCTVSASLAVRGFTRCIRRHFVTSGQWLLSCGGEFELENVCHYVRQ